MSPFAKIISLTGIISPPKMECGCLHGEVIENGHTRNPLSLTLRTVAVRVRVWVWVWVYGCGCGCTGVGVCTVLGDPQTQSSAEECYKWICQWYCIELLNSCE